MGFSSFIIIKFVIDGFGFILLYFDLYVFIFYFFLVIFPVFAFWFARLLSLLGIYKLDTPNTCTSCIFKTFQALYTQLPFKSSLFFFSVLCPQRLPYFPILSLGHIYIYIYIHNNFTILSLLILVILTSINYQAITSCQVSRLYITYFYQPYLLVSKVGRSC